MLSSNIQAIKQANIAILNVGLAGLALAAELSGPEFSHISNIVIETRDEYLRDKTWSYWRPNQQDNVPHDFSDCESATWPAWCVKDATNSVNID